MSAISMMESNSKSPFLWDSENLFMFATKLGEAPKTLQFVESEIEGIEVGTFYSSGGFNDGGTSSDLGYASLLRSSKSASDDSCTDREFPETRFSLETTTDCFQQDVRKKREIDKFEPTRTSPTIEGSAASGESLTALELCNRTYFEDISGVNTVKNTDQTFVLPDTSAKRSKSSFSLENSRCQVEGCNVDLSSAKSYHRKHRVCESHSKSPRVVINRHERRFCQQCSRFHNLSEFDQKKRSCRARLLDHNARRRKPKPEIIQFNSIRLASSLYEGGNQLNFGFNQVPALQTRHGAGAWDTTRDSDSKVTLAKSGVSMHCTKDCLSRPVTKVSPVSGLFSPAKGSTSEVYQPGLPTHILPSNVKAAHELRARSLLSTTFLNSGDHPEPSLVDHTIQPTIPSLTQPFPAVHPVPLGSGHHISPEFWAAEQPAALCPGSQTSSFQFKTSSESNFYLY